jgi:hypothetical protein
MNSGSPARPKESNGPRLSERDLKVLSLVAKFGISLFEIIHTELFKGLHRDAVKSILRRLCGKGPTYRYLRPIPLYGSRVAYQLTYRGAGVIGAPSSLARPLGVQARVERYAMLRFIYDRSETKRRPMTNAKLREFYPLAGHRLPRQRFFLEERPTGDYLGFVVVDHGGHERRIVRKAVDFLQRFLRHGWFDDDIADGQFVLTILTINDFKRRSIAYGLKKKLRQVLGKPLASLHPPYPGNWPLPVEIVVIPQLLNLIPGKTASSLMRRRHGPRLHRAGSGENNPAR